MHLQNSDLKREKCITSCADATCAGISWYFLFWSTCSKICFLLMRSASFFLMILKATSMSMLWLWKVGGPYLWCQMDTCFCHCWIIQKYDLRQWNVLFVCCAVRLEGLFASSYIWLGYIFEKRYSTVVTSVSKKSSGEQSELEK